MEFVLKRQVTTTNLKANLKSTSVHENINKHDGKRVTVKHKFLMY